MPPSHPQGHPIQSFALVSLLPPPPDPGVPAAPQGFDVAAWLGVSGGAGKGRRFGARGDGAVPAGLLRVVMETRWFLVPIFLEPPRFFRRPAREGRGGGRGCRRLAWHPGEAKWMLSR